jgi:hypothetical protein
LCADSTGLDIPTQKRAKRHFSIIYKCALCIRSLTMNDGHSAQLLLIARIMTTGLASWTPHWVKGATMICRPTTSSLPSLPLHVWLVHTNAKRFGANLSLLTDYVRHGKDKVTQSEDLTTYSALPMGP